MDQVFENYALPVLPIANSLGFDAIQSIVLPNLALFLSRTEKGELPFIYSILESYHILCQESLLNSAIYDSFCDYFGDAMAVFNQAPKCVTVSEKRDANFAHIKCDLLRTRRRISPRERRPGLTIDEVFELPAEESKVRKKMNEYKRDCGYSENGVTVGKTSLLLLVFKRKCKTYEQCQDHTLLWYNL
ncbi:uncharacterized protein LOC135124839 [Zophobas morio]